MSSLHEALRIRIATRADVPEIQRIRAAVRENRLVSRRIGDEEVIEYIERHGRGWVAVRMGTICGFAIGDARDGNIWALFVDPDCEGLGAGRLLHDTMVDWLFAQGLQRLYLGTEPATRAEGFYRCAGWTQLGIAHGEQQFERIANR
jgi:GNAT superfamily N-acetyltransferase